MSTTISLIVIDKSFSDISETAALGTYRTDTPTTINPNDATDAQIRNYYSSLSGLSTSERKGNNLLKNLKPILANNSYYYSYAKDWDVFMITDRDWTQSPLASYSGYAYGDNPYVHLLYRNDNGTSTAAHFNDTHGTYIDREHVWPQSRGFGASTATGPAGTDVHHLILGDSVNNQQGHSNYAWGDEDDGITPTAIGTSAGHNNTGIRWTATDIDGGSDNIYEPYDYDKGDIARAVFYMAARYNNWAGTSGAISAYEPFLQVTDEIYDSSEGTIHSTDTQPVNMGILSTLLKWHEQDPVDSYEIHRNNLIYYNFQNNRNPFIDFPEWVDAVYGSENKYATPSSDVINGYNETSILVSSITLNHDSMTLTAGGASGTLLANILPVDATNKTLNWGTGNSSVATVSGGVVTPVGVGTTTITATAADGSGVSDSCQISVVAEHEKVLDYIDVTGFSGSAPLGSAYNSGSIVVTAYYDDLSSQVVTSSATINTPDTAVLGEQTISVSYGGKTTYYIVTVTNDGASVSSGSAGYATDLFISEYIEGSSTNKYIEIYNGTGVTKDLSDYRLLLFSNGASTASATVTLSGTLNHDTTIVYRNSGGALSLPVGVNATVNSAVNFNGDDATALYKISTSAYVDIFGEIGFDPGSAWAEGGVSTVDKTLVRKSSVSSGVTTNPATFNPSVEWTQYPIDTASYLGSHTFSGAQSSGDVTASEQAIAWAQYFLDSTGQTCVAMSGDFSSYWSDLSDEYGFMANDAKDIFVNNEESNQTIANAITRYILIIQKYQIENFVTDGSENKLISSFFISDNRTDIKAVDVIVAALIAIGTVIAPFLFFRKRNLSQPN
ncbi:MAG: endonuclease [Bacilli bacterium]